MKNGPYILLIAPAEYPGMKYRNRYAYEHHIVYWQHHKKIPTPDQVVHHKNGIKHDNRIENLELLTAHEHNQHHHKPLDKIKFDCPQCGNEKQIRPRSYRERKRKNKYGVFCSKSCAAIMQHKMMASSAQGVRTDLLSRMELGSMPRMPANLKH